MVSVQQTQRPTILLAAYTKEVTRPSRGIYRSAVFRTEVLHDDKHVIKRSDATCVAQPAALLRISRVRNLD